MRFIVNTIADYIMREITGDSTVIRVVLPSYPPEVLFGVGCKVEELCHQPGSSIRLEYGIANRLGKEWMSGDESERILCARIRQKGWHSEQDNLTSLRNLVKDEEHDHLLILLAGYEHIEDQGSLRDFFHLDQQAIWDICLQKTFKGWVQDSLKDYVNLDDADRDIEAIADVFEALYENGLAHVLDISQFLEAQDFSTIDQGEEAYQMIMEGLPQFGLPPMPSLSRRHASKREFVRYIAPAQEFFNYSMFIDASKREKALEAIQGFNEDMDKEVPDEYILGSLASAKDPLRKLSMELTNYVQKRSPDAEALFKTVDFVYLYEKVLEYKPKGNDNGKPRRTTVRELTGLPPEVFLRGLWITIGDFVKHRKELLAMDSISTIALESIEFRHDFNGEDVPKTFLQRALGGIDDFFKDRLRLQPEEDGGMGIEVKSSLAPGDEDCQLIYRRHSNAEPHLKFRISISLREQGKTFHRDFKWALPQYHQTRLVLDLFTWAFDEYKKGSDLLPAFVMPYLGDISKARDEESVNRIIDTALKSDKLYVTDLLKAKGLDGSDQTIPQLFEVSFCHQLFTREVLEGGFFNALSKYYQPLGKAYSKVCEMHLEQSDESILSPLLLKVFMVVPASIAKNPGWVWDRHLQGSMVTPLHPALLEMIVHQHSYLCESFCYYARIGLQEVDGRTFTEGRWDRVLELATIHWPVFGTLKDPSLVLDTNVVGYGYFHLVGQFEDDGASISSKLLLQDDAVDEEEDITNVDLFRETQSSLLIERALLDYRKLHAHADDGITIGAYSTGDVQAIIAGIDAYLARISKERAQRPYSLRLIILSDSRYDANLIRWINAWKERWQDAEVTRQYYLNCIISVAYSVIPTGKSLHQLKKSLEGSFFDIVFFVNFLQSTANHFEPLGDDFSEPDDYQKFPVLDKIGCRLVGGGMDNRRQRVISNQRFKLGALHAEIMARMKGHRSKSHAIISTSDFQPWTDVIDTAHKQSGWVVCIDPSIDEQLIRKWDENFANRREIIGFGAGVGAHGENNYTISTEQFSMADISKKIGKQLSQLFGPMEPEIAERMAESLVAEASNMAGLSIVKATGPSQYVRDYVAYALVRKLLRRDDNAFCDELISLDAFWHWFDDADDKRRPDLLRIRAVVEDGYFRILAQVIECKTAKHSEGYLESARQQLEQGLNQLVVRFRPRENLKPLGVDDRLPDQRFWWMQLHRLIATKGVVDRANYKTTLRALERLSDGLFDITWQGAAVAFWTDVETVGMESNPAWQSHLDGQILDVSVATAGKGFPCRVCLENIKMDFFGKSTLSYSGVPASDKEQPKGGTPEISAVPSLIEQTIESAPSPSIPAGSASSAQRILLGSGTSGGRDIFWEFRHPELPNRHMIVFGASGTGKTYTIQALLWELAGAGQNSLIVDYTNGFSTNQLEPQTIEHLQPRQHIIRAQPLPINPFRRQCDFIDDQPLPEDPAAVARRVSDLFANVYNIGDQQQSVLYNVIRDGVTQQGDDFDLAVLIDRLEQAAFEGGPIASSAVTVLNKIQPFVDMRPFGEEDQESWERLFTDDKSRCHIIQLAGFTRDSARLITEFALFDFYWFYRARGHKDSPKVVVLDEIQNLDHRPGSPLAQLLTEGRKFGVSLVLATQTMSNFDRDERDRLFQASHKLFFKPADSEVRSFAQILADATNQPQSDWVNRLSSLKRGECYSLGYSWNSGTDKLEVGKSYRIRIRSLEDRA